MAWQKQLLWANVPMHSLEYEGFQREVFDEMNYNKESNQPIYWSLDYGMEALDSNGTSFIIHGPKN